MSAERESTSPPTMKERLRDDLDGAAAPRLLAALDELRTGLDAECATVDVTAAVLAKTRRTPTLAKRTLRWAPWAAAAALLLFVGRQGVWARELHLSAPHGALVFVTNAWNELRGERTVRPPVRVATRDHEAKLSGPGFGITLARASELAAPTADAVELVRGGAELVTDDALKFALAGASLELQGRGRAWYLGDNVMTRRQKLGLGGAVALLAIYGGHARFRAGQSNDAAQAPAALAIDESGAVRRVPVELAEAARSAENGRPSGDTSEATGGAARPRTGAIWDEAAGTVRFTLAGEAFDAQTGQPVTAFEVELRAETVRSFAAPRTVTASVKDATDGGFQVTGLGLGTYTLSVHAKGYAPSRQSVRLDTVTDDPFLVVPLSRGGSLTGSVVDWRGSPIADVAVSVSGCSAKDKAACPSAQTDARGNFVLPGAPEEIAFTVEARHPRYGYANEPNQRLAPGETRHLQLTLSGILRVAGRVLRGPKHEPVSGAVVRADDATTRTDTSGHYVLDMPLAEHPNVHVVVGEGQTASAFASYPESRSSEPIRWVGADTHVAELAKDFHLAMEAATLTGRITDTSGRPLSGGQLRLVNTMGWSSREHETFPVEAELDEEGRYRIDAVPAHAGYWMRLVTDGATRDLGTVVIEEPKLVEASFIVGDGTLRGRFVDAETGSVVPLDEAACRRFGAQREDSAGIYPARCLDDGSFEVVGLAPGRYRLLRVAPKLRGDLQVHETLAVLPPAGIPPPVDVRVRAAATSRWTVRVLDDAGRFVPSLMLRYHVGIGGSVTSGLQLSDEGTASFSIPVDQEQVFMDAPGYVSRELTLDAKATRDAVLEVRMQREQTTP